MIEVKTRTIERSQPASDPQRPDGNTPAKVVVTEGDNFFLQDAQTGERVLIGRVRELDAKKAFSRTSEALLKEANWRYPAPRPWQQPGATDPMQEESFFIREGVQYMPLAEAARHASVQRETLLNWIKTRVEFDSAPLDAFIFKPTGNHFVSKASVEKLAQRFVKWPSEEPAGLIEIGVTTQQTGYLPTSEAAKLIGVADPTLRKWVRQNKAPLDAPLNAVKCTTSGYFYIQHQDVLRLAKHVQAHGAPRGRRAQATPQP